MTSLAPRRRAAALPVFASSPDEREHCTRPKPTPTPPPTALPLPLPFPFPFMTPPQPRALPHLPYDILHSIVSRLASAHSVSALAATCRPLRDFIATAGWKIFCQTQFPSLYAGLVRHDDLEGARGEEEGEEIEWRLLARDLTALSRNWDRRGFVAGHLDPEIVVPAAENAAAATPAAQGTRRRDRGRAGGGARRDHPPPGRSFYRWSDSPGKGRQTVGFHPVLDAYSSPLASAEETLLVGAGPDLILRKRRRTGGARWWVYEDQTHLAGKDDITAVRLLREARGEGTERVLVGRANGGLHTVALRCSDAGGGIGSSALLASFETGGRAVRSASLLRSEGSSLLSAVLGNSSVAIWDFPSSSPSSTPVSPITGLSLPDDQQIWTSTFLTASSLAIGKTSRHPLSLHTLTPTGLSDATRLFAADDLYTASSVFAITPLPSTLPSTLPSASSTSTSDAGQLFLSGWYHGSTLLHDLRSPAHSVARFCDPVDLTSAVYSLLPLGRERILVGGARHNILKVFDLRMAGGKVYDAIGLGAAAAAAAAGGGEGGGGGVADGEADGGLDGEASGWATYLSAGNGGRYGRGVAERESPVYSLAASGCGEHVYAGVEGKVWELDFLDRRSQPQPQPPHTPTSTHTHTPTPTPTAAQRGTWRRDPERTCAHNWCSGNCGWESKRVGPPVRGNRAFASTTTTTSSSSSSTTAATTAAAAAAADGAEKRQLTMYEFGSRTRMWRQRGAEAGIGKPGEMGGRLDSRWASLEETGRRRW